MSRVLSLGKVKILLRGASIIFLCYCGMHTYNKTNKIEVKQNPQLYSTSEFDRVIKVREKAIKEQAKQSHELFFCILERWPKQIPLKKAHFHNQYLHFSGQVLGGLDESEFEVLTHCYNTEQVKTNLQTNNQGRYHFRVWY